MKPNCTTHHFACECREERFREIEQENELLKMALSEAVEIVKHLANSPHPYTVHEHRETLEHRFGLQIEVAQQFLERHKDKIESNENNKQGER